MSITKQPPSVLGVHADASAASNAPRVPAVRNAAAVLRFLRARGNAPAMMTEVCVALELNRSTCFNLLKVMADEGLLTYQPALKTYRLGPALIDFAAVIDDHGDIVRLSMAHARRLAHELRLTVALVRLTSSEEFVVLDKEDSPEPFRVTLPVGERFPANAAVLAKAHFAWMDEQTVDALIERLGLPARTDTTITEPERFKEELALVRRRGFATSVGEYYARKNTLAAPVFDRYGQVSHLLLVVALEEDLPADGLPACGERLREAAVAVTVQIGGSFPSLIEKEVDE